MGEKFFGKKTRACGAGPERGVPPEANAGLLACSAGSGVYFIVFSVPMRSGAFLMRLAGF